MCRIGDGEWAIQLPFSCWVELEEVLLTIVVEDFLCPTMVGAKLLAFLLFLITLIQPSSTTFDAWGALGIKGLCGLDKCKIVLQHDQIVVDIMI